MANSPDKNAIRDAIHIFVGIGIPLAYLFFIVLLIFVTTVFCRLSLLW